MCFIMTGIGFRVCMGFWKVLEKRGFFKWLCKLSDFCMEKF